MRFEFCFDYQISSQNLEWGIKKPPKNLGGFNVIYLFLNAVLCSSGVFDYPFPV
ncbi:hypothetical protein IWX80_001065 [Flavobacterium sp. CAN_S2]